MSNFIYYEKLEDYEEQVRKAKLCDEKDKEIERLNNIIEIKNKRIQQLMNRTRSARISKAIKYIEKCQLGVDSRDRPVMLKYLEEGRNLLEILKGGDKE